MDAAQARERWRAPQPLVACLRAFGARWASRETRFAYVLNAPSLLTLALLVGYPIGYSLWVSLHHYDLHRPRDFALVGLQNYVDILGDPQFWSALGVTSVFTVVAVTFIVVFGLLIALLLNRSFPGCRFVRAVVLIPWAMPPVVNGLMWQWIYDPKIGVLNAILRSLGVIDSYRGWLAQPLSALGGLIVAHTWNESGLAAIIFLGALQRIPTDLYDAGRVDGCRAWQLFSHITLPWLSQALMIVLILQTMLAVRVFDLIYVLTAGGPGTATTTVTWATFLTTFENLDFGHGSAYAYLVALLTLLLSVVYFHLLYQRGEFDA
ncbi:MAG: sugar ABC transporter permease [Rhodospirillales bacterium]|nr:sugar ABC transporter permease [Rhodospirillales bacterium]